MTEDSEPLSNNNSIDIEAGVEEPSPEDEESKEEQIIIKEEQQHDEEDKEEQKKVAANEDRKITSTGSGDDDHQEYEKGNQEEDAEQQQAAATEDLKVTITISVLGDDDEVEKKEAVDKDNTNIETGTEETEISENKRTTLTDDRENQERFKDEEEKEEKDDKEVTTSEKGEKEINKRYKDVRKTGQWGAISKNETIGMIVVVIIIFITAIVVGITLIGDTEDEASPKERIEASEKVNATIEASDKFNAIIEVMSQYEGTRPSYDNVDDYRPLELFGDVQPLDRAISWAIYEDEPSFTYPYNFSYSRGNLKQQIMLRFGFASFYFHLNQNDNIDAESGWKEETNWLDSTKHVCEWYGVTCDGYYDRVLAIKINENNLIGTLPFELALFTDLTTIMLKDNSIKGELQSILFQNMKKLFVLQLQGNQFSGLIPSNIQSSPTQLSVFYLQGNNFTGRYPDEYCKIETSGTDCDKTECNCCNEKKEELECYY